jgi:fucose permease
MASIASPPRTFRFSTSGTTLIHIDFLVTGVVMTFLGPMLPILSARWSLPDVKAGDLIFAEFFSSMFGMLLSGVLVERVGYRLTLILGLILMASGMIMLASGPFLLGTISVCIFGIGYGVTTPAGNLRTAEINPQRSAAALNVINAVWGVGAMSSPFLIAMAQRAHRISWFLYGTAAALLALLVALLLSRFVPDTHAHTHPNAGRQYWKSAMLPVICVLFFLYVGTETSFGAWVATYARRMEKGQSAFWAMTPSFFWGALLAGRALAPVALRYTRQTNVAKAGLFTAFIGALAIVNARGMTLIVVGAILAGFGLASIFPISVSLFPNWFRDSARTASGAIFSSGNIGGAVVPWIVGAVSTHFDSLRTAFLVPLSGIVLMLAFYLVHRPPELASQGTLAKSC